MKPARVKEARVNMECKLHQIVHVSPKFLGGSLVMGEVLRFHVQDSMINQICEIDADQLRCDRTHGGSGVRAHEGSVRDGAPGVRSDRRMAGDKIACPTGY